MKKYFKLSALIILIFVVSCSRDDTPQEEQLPTGENTAYYYLDGQLIVPKGVAGGLGSSSIKPIYYTNCSQQSPPSEIQLFTPNTYIRIFLFNGIQITEIKDLKNRTGGGCSNINNTGTLEYKKTSGVPWIDFETINNSGTVIINYVSANKRKFSGTFQMDVYSNTNEVKHITNGHFNINLDTL